MTNSISGNFRHTSDPFTMVMNVVIEDKNLSMKAKGLYLIIKHYITIPNFILNKGYLMSLSKEGERAFDSTWKELKDAGYLKQYRLKGEGGKWIYEYELLHEPQIEIEGFEKEVKQNKKPSTSAKVNDYNSKVKNKKSSNKSICNTTTNNTPAPKKNIQENIVIKLLKENNIQNIKEKEAIETFTDINKLNASILKCNGIKEYRYLLKVYNTYQSNNCNNKKGINSYEGDWVNAENLDERIEMSQKVKFGGATNYGDYGEEY